LHDCVPTIFKHRPYYCKRKYVRQLFLDALLWLCIS